MRSFRIAVVGGGISGASAARQLSERGHDVPLFEQHPQGHDLGSAHGRSRIVRRAYPDRFYTECMAEAYPMWRELEGASCEQRLHEVGLFYFGSKDSEQVQSVAQGLRELDVPHEILEGDTVETQFPQIHLEPNEMGIFTPEAGWVRADVAVSSTLMLAQEAGCGIVTKRVTAADLLSYERVVVCAGPWIRDWWPDAPVTTTLQTYGYIEGGVGGPVWIADAEDRSGFALYGFPNEPARHSFKLGVHGPGPAIDADRDGRTPHEQALSDILEFAGRRFGISDPKLVESKGCVYTSTENEDFLLRMLDERTFMASACSGHGFKFGPWIGKLLADLIEERVDLGCYTRFLG